MAKISQAITPMIEGDLIHYSAEPLGELYVRAQDKERPMKPNGLWLSVEDGSGWREWCNDNDFALDNFVHAYKITLAEKNNILHLKTAQEIIDFSEQYADTRPEFKEIGLLRAMYLNWSKVAEDYQGLIISPYQWSCRHNDHCMWYYGWDCSSGCIWDVSAIATVEDVTDRQKAS